MKSHLNSVHWQNERQCAQTETPEIISEHNKTLFYFEGGQTPEQVVQGDCRVSILGCVQHLAGHDPG